MKYLKGFNEDFTPLTIDYNNKEYLKFFKSFKDSDKRNNIVAWGAENSQLNNWDLISRYIKDGDSVLDYGCGIGDFITYIGDSGKKISNYLGVDINPEFIKMAKESYPDNDFKLIKDINGIDGKYDIVFASGVFTWFITKSDFISIINKLYEVANKEVLMTFNYKRIKQNTETFWSSKYRYYTKEIFEDLFPDWNIEYYIEGYGSSDYLLVRIKK